MKIALDPYMIRHLPLPELCRATAELGYEQIELSMNIFVVGDQMPPWIERFIGADVDTLIQHDSLAIVEHD